MEPVGTQGARSQDGTASLLEAILSISAGLDLRTALDRLVRASCDLTRARYGVLGILDQGGVVTDLVIHGVDAETAERIASLPTCEGVLEVLVDDPRPLRLTDVADHARSMGFPPNHPPMRSFLGVPVLVEGAVYGNLCLTEKAGGEPFSAEDESLLVTLAGVAGFVIANARAHEASERRRRWLESSIEMSHELQNAADLTFALGQVATRLRAVSDAVLVAVVEHLGHVTLVSADGGAGEVSASDLTALVDLVRPVLRGADLGGDVVKLPRPDGTSVSVVPLPSRLVPGHSLVVVHAEHQVGVAAADTDLLTAFADQAALALDRTKGLVERQEHVLVADRDRIARDLHDTVIQRLFATALQLQGLRRQVATDDLKLRLDDAVAELNTTIRDIRSTIFELRQTQGGSLKSEIRGLVRDYVAVLGFTPFVRIHGPIDAGVPEAAWDHLMATLRESLSNVARHSDADACVVEVEVDQRRLLLRVADNGCGIGTATHESGLQNIRRRALELDGDFRVTADRPRGTVLEWQVPLNS